MRLNRDGRRAVRKPHKYGAKKSPCAKGHVHDSKREATICDQLHYRLWAGEIFNLLVQHQFYFVIDGKPLKLKNGRRAGIKIDFFYTETKGMKDVAEDAKGFTVRDYPLRAALFRHCFPMIELREV